MKMKARTVVRGAKGLLRDSGSEIRLGKEKKKEKLRRLGAGSLLNDLGADVRPAVVLKRTQNKITNPDKM